ncbi:hypothetical protein PENTCL1PPCAC_13003, partial [Pristionchus entomophagus]
MNPSLSWSLDDYNVTSIGVPSSAIFGFSLEACAFGHLEKQPLLRYRVHYIGLVSARRDTTLRTKCLLSYAKYPFDHQACVPCLESQREDHEALLVIEDLEKIFLERSPEYTWTANITMHSNSTYQVADVNVAEVYLNLMIKRDPVVPTFFVYVPALQLYFGGGIALANPHDPEYLILITVAVAFSSVNNQISTTLERTGTFPGLAWVVTGLETALYMLTLLLVTLRKYAERIVGRTRIRQRRDATGWRYFLGVAIDWIKRERVKISYV